jgi:PPOX class probable FMN-dependent enzyme
VGAAVVASLTTAEELRALYGEPHARSVAKEITFLNEQYQAFVTASPFVILASSGVEGIDCSPKGDAPGFVQILDERTLAVPDRPGNNRIDNLLNIVADPRVSLLFLVPGVGETLRVNGRAEISTDADLLQRFAVGGKLPRTVIVVRVEAVYFHCAKALMRSQLWDPARYVPRGALPSAGDMIAATCDDFDGEAYDLEAPQRAQRSLY